MNLTYSGPPPLAGPLLRLSFVQWLWGTNGPTDQHALAARGLRAEASQVRQPGGSPPASTGPTNGLFIGMPDRNGGYPMPAQPESRPGAGARSLDATWLTYTGYRTCTFLYSAR